MDNTAETTRIIKLTLRIAHCVGAIPYTWSDQKRKVEFSGRRSLRYSVFVAQLSLYVTYLSFVIARWIQLSYFQSNVTAQGKSGLQYVAFSYCMPLLLQLVSFCNIDQLHFHINSVLQYQQGSLSSKMEFMSSIFTPDWEINGQLLQKF